MEEWTRDFRRDLERRAYPLPLLLAESHWSFLRIHPFDDGNGRTARLLANYALLRKDLPPIVIKSEHRDLYIGRRRASIARQRRHFETFHPLPEEKRYLSGATHLYLGRQYRLKIHHAREANVELIGRYVGVPEPEMPRCVRATLDAWYRRHARRIFRRYMPLYRGDPDSAGGFAHPENPLMTRRRASCSKRGTITLSTELIKTPLHCIEHVIMHELCHL